MSMQTQREDNVTQAKVSLAYVEWWLYSSNERTRFHWYKLNCDNIAAMRGQGYTLKKVSLVYVELGQYDSNEGTRLHWTRFHWYN